MAVFLNKRPPLWTSNWKPIMELTALNKNKVHPNIRAKNGEVIKGSAYATFRSSGIEVDLDRYFSTPEGREAWNKVARVKSVKNVNRS